jgi:hypothetical protein
MAINFRGEKISRTESNRESVETIVLSYSDIADFRKLHPFHLDADEFELKK